MSILDDLFPEGDGDSVSPAGNCIHCGWPIIRDAGSCPTKDEHRKVDP